MEHHCREDFCFVGDGWNEVVEVGLGRWGGHKVL